MGKYVFEVDLDTAKKTEEEIATILANRGYNVFQNSGPSWDLRIERDGQVMTIEIKEDFLAAKTGNAAVEYESRGKPSGIAVTKADFWWFRLHGTNGHVDMIVPTASLKLAVTIHDYHDKKVGGDEGSETKMYLFHPKVLKRYAI